ncbi:BRO family protein [Brachybacterium paraconglomeratum]
MSDLTPSTPSATSPFDAIKRTRPDGTEYWAARELMPLLGYDTWRSFAAAIDRAMSTAQNQGLHVAVEFSQVSQLADAGNLGSQTRADYELSRFAAYLVAMNGDPRKPEIAAAQAYFAIRTREAELAPAAPVALPGRRELAQMVLEAEDRADREAIARARVEYQLEQQEDLVDYHRKFVAESQDIVTIDNFASQFGTTGPKVRELMKDKGVAVRRVVAQRWSKSKNRMVDDYEWRPRQGVLSSEWFVLRPQHNAPRLHNGQVRQTLYVLQFHVQHLATKLGLNAPALDVEGSELR